MKRWFLLSLSLVMLVSPGCHKKTSVKPPAPAPPAPTEAAPPAVTPPLISASPAPFESATLPTTITAPSNLELCEMNFQVRNYKKATDACEAYLRNNLKAKHRDQALFLLGLSLDLANDSSRDMRQAEAAFRRLISEYPASPYKGQAEFILGLHAQIEKLRSDIKERDERIKKLSDELQVLKDIDLQRRPSRPNP